MQRLATSLKSWDWKLKRVKMKKKIGIIGGSFDPVHLGHLGLARDAMIQADLNEIVFMPAAVQPFKVGERMTPSDHRMSMLELALGEEKRFRASDYELRQRNISYTFHTLDSLKKNEFKDCEVLFISGTDAFLSMPRWKNGKKLMEENSFIVGVRPGYREEELNLAIKNAKERWNTKVIKIDNEKHLISATEIRRCIREGLPVNHLVPHRVEAYIREKNLYAADYKTIVGDIREFVKNRLSEKRWKHTLGVEKMAIELARKYDANMEVCSVAALAHDMGRGFDKDIYEKLINEYGIDNRYGGNLNLGHSKLGAAMAAKIFYIEDEKIINAIAYHTTGRPYMTKEEIIVFLADALEESRSYEGVEELRAILRDEGLERACLAVIDHTLEYLKSIGIQDSEIDKDTLDTRKWLVKGIN